MSTFQERAEAHDELGTKLVIDQFSKQGISCWDFGVEHGDKSLFYLLKEKTSNLSTNDYTAMMMNFRPDLLCTSGKQTSLLCEIKTEEGLWTNFSFNAEAFYIVHQWSFAFRDIMYACVDLKTKDIFCCWCDELFEAAQILFIPEFGNVAQSKMRMKEFFPGRRLIETNYSTNNSGSGLPYFLISKDDEVFLPYKEFLGLLPTSSSP